MNADHTADCSPLVRVQTEGEQARAEMAARMLEFAKANLPSISENEYLPGSPAHWDDPKTSLLSHPGVNKAVKVLASVAAQNCWYRLHYFHWLHPDRMLAELRLTRDGCIDAKLAGQFDIRAAAFAKFITEITGTPATEFLEAARIYRSNVAFAVSSVLGYCQGVVGEWLEAIPAENFPELLTELQQLKAAPLPVQLRWFGLTEFITED